MWVEEWTLKNSGVSALLNTCRLECYGFQVVRARYLVLDIDTSTKSRQETQLFVSSKSRPGIPQKASDLHFSSIFLP